jgi:hypothetical protein
MDGHQRFYLFQYRPIKSQSNKKFDINYFVVYYFSNFSWTVQVSGFTQFCVFARWVLVCSNRKSQGTSSNRSLLCQAITRSRGPVPTHLTHFTLSHPLHSISICKSPKWYHSVAFFDRNYNSLWICHCPLCFIPGPSNFLDFLALTANVLS